MELMLIPLRKDASVGGETMITGGRSGLSLRKELEVLIDVIECGRGCKNDADEADDKIESRRGLKRVVNDMERAGFWSSRFIEMVDTEEIVLSSSAKGID